jgi:light-regulated signal transduction histidine kinase (bacteriophytochrome)
MCGNVIRGQFDPSRPFFSAQGSFWTNSTTEFLAEKNEANRQFMTRDRCNGQGYESVLLLPLKIGNLKLGLLQLSDCTKGMFSPASIALWERLSGYLAVALAKEMAEEELRQTAAELKRSNQDLEQFAYVASHDLQEPLRIVSGFLTLLQNRYGGQLDAMAREYIAHSSEGAQRMSQLIYDMLEYSQVKNKTLEPTDAGDSLVKALDNLRGAIQASQAAVTYDELPMVMGDPVQLVQLFQNLIDNAIKFRVPGRPCQVHVGIQKEQARCVFHIRDNGIGIPADQHDRIFQIFQRLHSHTKYPGTGIGLAICKRIVERHGGSIWVESTPGEGSTFSFSLSPASPG